MGIFVDYDDREVSERVCKHMLNRFYGKVDDATHYTGWPTPQPRIPVPELHVPTPAPTMQPEPESPSIQLLRGLLADRRKTMASAEAAQKSRHAQIESLQKRIDDLTARNADDQRTFDAGKAAVTEILADIEKLGGAAEA